MKPENSILGSYGTTIFTVMSALAVEHGAINLGQGFPDADGPEDIRRRAADALVAGPNQYPPMMGTPELRQAVADHNRRFYGIDVDWRSGVMVTSGATEALADCLLGLIEPGDEVILMEPLYDSYLPIVRLAGAVPRLARLEPPDWQLPRRALEAAFSDRTKLVVLNSPHNPTGKVFDRDDLAFLAELLVAHDAYFRSLGRDLVAKRDRLSRGLAEAGFAMLRADGTYFLTADVRPLGFDGDDEAFCRHIVTQAGVAAVPVGAFYRDDGPRHYVRFCFCKSDAVLDEAVARLKRHFGRR